MTNLCGGISAIEAASELVRATPPVRRVVFLHTPAPGHPMAETLLEHSQPIVGPDATAYRARTCASEMPDGRWQGWIEFLPLSGGLPLRSPRETTQPNRADAAYWATGLTTVYLEGALARAIEATMDRPPGPAPDPPLFSGPAERPVGDAGGAARDSVLDPFSVYRKGEALLRRQLAALSPWHLVNIVRRHRLTDERVETLSRLPGTALIERIVAGVRVAGRSKA